MTEEDIAVQLARIDERSHRNEARIKALEGATEALHKIASSVEVIAHEQCSIKEDVRALTSKLGAVEARPGKLWDKLSAALLGAVASGLIAFLLLQVGLA